MNKPNTGIGDYIIIMLLALTDGFYKFGFVWYGFKAICFGWYVLGAYIALQWILYWIIDNFKK
jgi:hypothetical protein